MFVHVGEINEKLVNRLLSYDGTVLQLQSYGGEVYSMLSIVDQLVSHGMRVIATGIIASAAVPIVACAVQKVCTPHTRFMVHKGSIALPNVTGEELEKESEEWQVLTDIYWGMLGQYTKRSASWWRKQCLEAPYYFGAREAVKLGVVQDILA